MNISGSIVSLHVLMNVKAQTDGIVLSAAEKQFFLLNGYVTIKNAFSRDCASLCVDEIWSVMEQHENVLRKDSSTWPEKCPLRNSYNSGNGYPWNEVVSPKLIESVSDIVDGKEKRCNTNLSTGWWMVTFPYEYSSSETNDPKAECLQQINSNVNMHSSSTPTVQVAGHWHIDGHMLQHNLFNREIGVVAVMYYTDVAHSGGGTAVAVGSHLVAIKCLAARLSGDPISHCEHSIGNHDDTSSDLSEMFEVSNTVLAQSVIEEYHIASLARREMVTATNTSAGSDAGDGDGDGDASPEQDVDNVTFAVTTSSPHLKGTVTSPSYDRAAMYGECEIKELIGDAGDIILMHPWLLHTRTRNSGDSVRIMSHPNIVLSPLSTTTKSGSPLLMNSLYQFDDASLLRKCIPFALQNEPELLTRVFDPIVHQKHVQYLDQMVTDRDDTDGQTGHPKIDKYKRPLPSKDDLELESLFGFKRFKGAYR